MTVLSQGLPVEVTTFRREGTYSDGRHPDQVSFTTSLTEDLARRDFTINAMAWDEDGLADRFGGRADLEAGSSAAWESRSAAFRRTLCASSGDFGWPLSWTLPSIRTPPRPSRTETPRLAMVARERIGGEFLRLLCGPGAGRVLLDFPQTVCEIVPQLVPTVGFDQKNPHHAWDVYTHLVKTVEKVPPEPALRLAALLPRCGQARHLFYG